MHCMFWANICRPKFILRHSRSRAKDSLQLTNEAKVNSCGGAIKRQQGPNSEGRREAAMHGKGHASHAAHNEARLGGRQFSANNSPWRGRPKVAVRPSVRPCGLSVSNFKWLFHRSSWHACLAGARRCGKKIGLAFRGGIKKCERGRERSQVFRRRLLLSRVRYVVIVLLPG